MTCNNIPHCREIMATMTWLMGICAIAQIRAPFIPKFDPNRDYSDCWKPCIFSFCKPWCPATTTTTPPPTTATTNTTSRNRHNKANTIPWGPTRPTINWNYWDFGMSEASQRRFNWGVGITCIILLVVVCIMETKYHITRCINYCFN